MSEPHVSKSEFARLVNRSPACITKWINTGKLTAPALIGEGYRARIDPDAARAQLRLTLDPAQQLAQAAPMRAGTTALAAPPPNDDAARLMRARADREELDLQQAQAKAAALQGHWMVTADARDAWTAEAARFIHAIESWLVTGATQDLAALDTRDKRMISATLKSGFRQLCDRIADKAAAPPAAEEDGDGDPEEESA